jgi:hypothetical protein
MLFKKAVTASPRYPTYWTTFWDGAVTTDTITAYIINTRPKNKTIGIAYHNFDIPNYKSE